jgi:hypothetical protein
MKGGCFGVGDEDEQTSPITGCVVTLPKIEWAYQAAQL